MFPITRRSVLALLVAGTFFMTNLDGSVITPAIPTMATSFAVQPVDLNIGVSSYLLSVGVFIPISGWVAERFGRGLSLPWRSPCGSGRQLPRLPMLACRSAWPLSS